MIIVPVVLFLIVMILGEPGQVGGPLEVSNITEDSCDLAWRAPIEDGGSPVTHYKIEKQDVTAKSEWTPVHKFCRTTKHEVSDLTTGMLLTCSELRTLQAKLLL